MINAWSDVTLNGQNFTNGDDLYHTNCNPYHSDKNGFITHGVYHIGFSKRVDLKNRNKYINSWKDTETQ